ncbi:MAG TPA: acetyl-CoA hydrolase/transferase C-terminal domain-containing protein [Caulobacteraceae bacterium]
MRQKANTPARRITAAEAAGLVRSGMWIDLAGGLGQPDTFDAALAERVAELTDVKFRTCLSLKPLAHVEADPSGSVFRTFSWHFGGYERAKHAERLCGYTPLNLGEVPDYYRRFIDPVDIAVIRARPMDADGVFNFSLSNLWFRAVIERARLVIVEEVPGYPHVHGLENGIHIDEVDYVIEGDRAPPGELPNPPASEIDKAVARLIAAEVEDGACLQIGIGGMPNAVCTLLKDAGVRDLGVHTEMLTDGLVELYSSGSVTGVRKTTDQGKVTFTFGMGSKSLFEAVDGNPDFLCCPVDHTNLPQNIMRNDKVVSINSTTHIDLQGQAVSESDGHRHLTGTGGQLQFVRGAYASEGGKSFICLPSTFERKGVRKSRIVLDLTPGDIVTTPRSDVMYVVTEYGAANLKGRTVEERAQALIGLAHPDFRDDLARQARAHGLICCAWSPGVVAA